MEPELPPQNPNDDRTKCNPGDKTGENPEDNGGGNNINSAWFFLTVLWAAIEAGTAWFFWWFSDPLEKHGYPKLSDCSQFLAGALILAVIAHGAFRAWKATRPKTANRVWWAYGFAIIVLACVFLIICSNRTEQSTDEDDNPIGELVPANDPELLVDLDPGGGMGPQRFPPEYTVLELGGNFWLMNPDQDRFVFQFKGQAVLSLDVIKKRAYITGTFRDKAGNIVAELVTNNFMLNRLNYLSKKGTDKNTLIVRDQQGIEMLNARFARTNLFLLTGRFRFPDGTEAIATTTNFIYGHHILSGCIGYDPAELVIETNGGVGF
ncbi:MAG: hypothetical protein ABSF10_02245 [Verrucomicrobiota bacterium]